MKMSALPISEAGVATKFRVIAIHCPAFI